MRKETPGRAAPSSLTGRFLLVLMFLEPRLKRGDVFRVQEQFRAFGNLRATRNRPGVDHVVVYNHGAESNPYAWVGYQIEHWLADIDHNNLPGRLDSTAM